MAQNTTAIVAALLVVLVAYAWIYHRNTIKKGLNKLSTAMPTSLVDNSGDPTQGPQTMSPMMM